jgi:hypothetical protein
MKENITSNETHNGQGNILFPITKPATKEGKLDAPK